MDAISDNAPRQARDLRVAEAAPFTAVINPEYNNSLPALRQLEKTEWQKS
jgi:hypothetical protein